MMKPSSIVWIKTNVTDGFQRIMLTEKVPEQVSKKIKHGQGPKSTTPLPMTVIRQRYSLDACLEMNNDRMDSIEFDVANHRVNGLLDGHWPSKQIDVFTFKKEDLANGTILVNLLQCCFATGG